MPKNGAGYDTDMEDVGVMIDTENNQQVTVSLTDNEIEEITNGESLSFLFLLESTGEQIEIIIRKDREGDCLSTYTETTE